MAINYVGQTLFRAAGQTAGKPPLILRNQFDDDDARDKWKCGPQAVLAFGPNDYRQYYEGLSDDFSGATNWWMYATATSPWTWTKDAGPYALAPNTGDWEQGEVCPTKWLYDPVDELFKMIYHGGNNAGPRQIGLATAPRTSEGAPGAWTRYGSNPVITPGSSGAWNDDGVADCTVIVPPSGDWLAFYRGIKASDGDSRIGLATSSDRGFTWTPYASNPVIDTGAGNIAEWATAPWGYMDELGRIHLWLVGQDASDVNRILYAYSDDDGETFTFDPTDIILDTNPGGAPNDPDVAVGDVVSGLIDEGLVIVGCSNFNLASYDGDAVGRLDGRGFYWLPCEAASAPTRPGRAYTSKVAESRQTMNVAASLLNSSVFTVYAEFKVPPGNTYREIYTEQAAFNINIFLRLQDDGQMQAWYRTPTGISNIITTERYDDGLIHRVMWVRRDTDDFELYVDGVSVGTDTTECATDATAPGAICWCNWDPSTGEPDEPLMGWLRQTVTIAGTALTTEQEATLWNGGAAGGTLPVTATSWIQHGSGGASADAAYGGATYGGAALTGSKVVNAAPNETIDTTDIDQGTGASDGWIRLYGSVVSTDTDRLDRKGAEFVKKYE